MNHFNLYFLAHGLLLSSIYHGNSVLAEKDSGVIDPFSTTPEREFHVLMTTNIESDGSMKMMSTPTELSPLRIINVPTTNATTIARGGALLAMNETNDASDASDAEFRSLTRSNSGFPGFVPAGFKCSYNKNSRRVTSCGNTVDATEFCGITTDDVKSTSKVKVKGTCYEKYDLKEFNLCKNDLVGNNYNNSCKEGYCKNGRCVPYLKKNQKCTVFDRNSPDFECAKGFRCARGTSFGKCKPGKVRSLLFAEEL